MKTDYRILKTGPEHVDFKFLVKKLDQDLAVTDGDEHAFYDQFNKIDSLKYVLVLYVNNVAAACGAIKEFDAQSMEVKRMYTSPKFRGKGLASAVLLELEKWTKDLNKARCILETGIRQPDAIALYKKNNFVVTENYGQYIGVENSVCFEKWV